MKKTSTRSTRKVRGGVKNTRSPSPSPSSSPNPKPIPPDGKRRTTRSTGYQAYRIQLHAWLKKEEEKKNRKTQRKKE
jgi:hypothetical protein